MRRTRAGLGRTVRSAHRGTVASQVLMQLLLRGQRLGPLEGLLCFSPFACASLLVGVIALELPGLRDGGLATMAEHPLVFLGQACSEQSHSAYSHSVSRPAAAAAAAAAAVAITRRRARRIAPIRYTVAFAACARCGHPLRLALPSSRLRQAALGFMVNLLTILTVKLTSSISFKLISMAKNAAIVLLSVPIFHNKISPTQVHHLP